MIPLKKISGSKDHRHLAGCLPYHFIIHLEGNVEKPVTLGSVVGAYKSITTVAWLKHINDTGMECSGRFWQSNYYERVIRDGQELEQTRQYIRNNPLKRKEGM